MSEVVNKVADAAGRLFSSQEFAHYAAHKAVLLKRVASEHATLEARLRPADDELNNQTHQLFDLRRATQKRRWRILLYSIVPIFAILSMAIWKIPSSTLTNRFGALIAWTAVPALLIASTWAILVERAKCARMERMVFEAHARHRRELTAVATEMVTAAINEELGPRGIVAFPTDAPRLVELDTSMITPSAPVAYVKGFMKSHDSSAIGLAGSRGSGKSTVMRALRNDEMLSRYLTIIPAPVKYNDGEFIRRLLSDIASLIAGPLSEPAIKRVRRTRRTAFLTTGVVGVIFALLRLLDLSSEANKIDIYLAVGLGMIIFSVIGVVFTMINSLASIGLESGPADIRQARRIQHLLKWEIEQTTTSKNTFKIWSIFEGADDDSVKAKSRAMSHADLVMELRHLLTLFASAHPDDKLVVCVDELDKLDKPESLVSITNELKDLFHIEGIHFLVTVSTDALASFEQRGLPTRDAFDSAFDVIVNAGHLTLDESVAVVKARAAGFAPLIAMFCHAWSGGLARDLLRTARMAVELQRRSDTALTIVDLVSHVVLHDLREITLAAVRTANPADPDITHLWDLHNLTKTVTGSDDHDLQSLTFQSQAGEILRAKAMLGMRLINLAVTMSKFDTFWDTANARLTSLGSILEDIATAITEITGPEPMRKAAILKATRRFDLGSELASA
ncbi:P-loop NTPase fold protein [Amycolatopsis sp. DG1A-15b]|uniref:P-loop NTPase fold protein n=1 Tax=Amycolatopsis sp. DG1A-15b TaxID=3052846 RepID=UPI00255B57C2|nr:P-loop NTPase fold protein [Amycolatopsis sp. DG1A-15b]WIX85762.1 P-loop NTPase fold protein [Amycolatopsis sp. DG1A-15b]